MSNHKTPRLVTWQGFLLILLLLAFSGSASALRCGNHLVSEQDTAAKLVQFCGQPAHVDQMEDTYAVSVYDRNLGKTVTEYRTKPYEIWTYNFGPRRLMMRITVREGMITSIDSAGYGY